MTLPKNITDGIVFPRFDYLFTGFGIQMMITYALVASLESLITASAIDKIDRYKRKSNFNRELFAKGGGNIISSSLGGLPIIAEVVRSSANVANGAVSRWSNFYHGVFLLIFLVFLSPFIHQIPLSALAAMLMVTGYRLASPKEFYKNLRIGKEQFIIFLVTILATIASDLLIGIAFGIIVKLVIHYANGVPLKVLFKPFLTIQQDDAHDVFTVDVEHSAVFSNYIGFQKQLQQIPKGKTIIIDFERANLVDGNVLESLHSFKDEYKRKGGEFIIKGLDDHEAASSHKFASRRK
ncbi:MAG: solute carrier family 23 protein [Bacteroidia bacterium]